MGMDVYGKSPRSKEGEYFRCSCWGWRPLADYCRLVAPEICAACTYWQSNDGDGLDDAGSQALAAVLRAKLSSGETAAYVAVRDAELAAMPDEKCWLCEGTGYRAPPPMSGPGEMPCNACGTKGTLRPNDTRYPMNAETVAEFATFLEGCGGFEIC